MVLPALKIMIQPKESYRGLFSSITGKVSPEKPQHQPATCFRPGSTFREVPLPRSPLGEIGSRDSLQGEHNGAVLKYPLFPELPNNNLTPASFRNSTTWNYKLAF